MNEIREYDRSLFYRFCRVAVKFLVAAMYRYRVVGASNVPSTGPVVFCSNHIHNFDPPILGLSTTRYVHFMAKGELFKIAPLAWLIRRLGAFPVRRGGQDKGAIRTALQIPKNNACIVIFPEGHRSKDGKLGKGMAGAAFIARKAQCPIVPTAIVGSYRIGSKLTVRFGTPILPDPEDTNDSLMEKIMNNIAKLIDEDNAS